MRTYYRVIDEYGLQHAAIACNTQAQLAAGIDRLIRHGWQLNAQTCDGAWHEFKRGRHSIALHPAANRFEN
jgi:hypothetical protein